MFAVDSIQIFGLRAANIFICICLSFLNRHWFLCYLRFFFSCVKIFPMLTIIELHCTLYTLSARDTIAVVSMPPSMLKKHLKFLWKSWNVWRQNGFQPVDWTKRSGMNHLQVTTLCKAAIGLWDRVITTGGCGKLCLHISINSYHSVQFWCNQLSLCTILGIEQLHQGCDIHNLACVNSTWTLSHKRLQNQTLPIYNPQEQKWTHRTELKR